VTYFVACQVICTNNALDCDLRPLHRCLVISDQEHVLLVIIIGLGRSALFLASFSSYQDFAVCLLFKSFLVQAFGANDHAYVVDACILGNVDLLFKLVSFMDSFKHLGFWIIRIFISSAGKKISLLREN
jgi:hypothetical protein